MKSGVSEQKYSRETAAEKPFKFFFLRLLLTCGIGLLLLLLFASADYLTSDPNRHAALFSLSALYLTSLVGGILLSASPLPFYLSGLLGGGGFLLLLTAFSCVFPGGMSLGFPVWLSVLLHLLIIVCFVIGSLAGHLFVAAPRRRRRKKRA